MSTLRWGVMCVMQAFSHLSGAIRSVEHAVIGRRTCEVEWDLLELLDPDGAARAALGDTVLPQLSGRPAFETRVTMRALGIVRRELQLTDEHAAQRAATLAALGVGDEAELGAAIRDGAFEGREHELLGALRVLVAAKLEVANPGYTHKETP
jgi:Domain of unknown function (DUF6285)